MDYKEEIIRLLAKQVPLKKEEILKLIEVPRVSGMGDYAFPCFSLATLMRKSPNEIASKIASGIGSTSKIIVTAVNAYVNFSINKEIFTNDIISRILKEKEKFGSSNEGGGKKVLVEHTSINPNAPPHVGTARNAIIGDIISRLLKFQEQFIICNFCEGIGYIHGTTDMYPEGNPLHHTYNDCKICKGKGVIKKRLFKQLKDKNFDKSNLINCADCKKRIANKSILKVNEDLFFIELGIRKNSEMILGGGNSEFYLCLKCYKKFKSKLQGIINFKEVERYI